MIQADDLCEEDGGFRPMSEPTIGYLATFSSNEDVACVTLGENSD